MDRVKSPAPVRFPVLIVTGFLGSGKTTLINALLRDAAFADSAVIVNEFGEIGLDHLIIATARDNIVLLDAGCLCCTMLDSLRETVIGLVERRRIGAIPPFRRILIEMSGLADPAPVIAIVTRDPVVGPLLSLGGVLAVIDARHVLAQFAEHPEAAVQVALADTLVVAKLDGGAIPQALTDALARINPLATATTAEAVQDRPASLLEPSTRIAETSSDAHTRHSEGVASHSYIIDGATDWPAIARWTGELREQWGPRMLRVKALLEVAPGGEAVLLDGVRGLYEYRRLGTWPDELRGCRIVLIGAALDPQSLAEGIGRLGEGRKTQ